MRKLLVVFMMLSVFLTACSNHSHRKDNIPTPLSIGSINELPAYTVAALKTKFPSIPFTFTPTTPDTIRRMYNSGTLPDILLDVDNVSIPIDLLDKIRFDLAPLIRKNNVDINRFEPSLIDHVKSYGKNGEIYALPYSRYLYALFYNKTLFTSSGVPIPKDHMSWNQIIDLANRLSASLKASPEKRAFDPLLSDLGLVSILDQNSLVLVDPQTDRAAVQGATWKNTFELLRSIYSIPGNAPKNPSSIKDFTEKGIIAMTIHSGLDLLEQSVQNGLDVDVATYPYEEGRPDIAPGTRTVNLMMTSTSKNKDQAFEVMTYLTSDEVQTQNARMGLAPILKQMTILSQFGANRPELKGKNLAAFTQNKLPNIKPISPYEGTAYLAFAKSLRPLLSSDLTVDAAFNEINHSIDGAIGEVKKKQKD